MEVNIKMKVKPFKVPRFVMADKKTSDPSNDTKFALADLDVKTLNELCERFVSDVFKMAGKKRPSEKDDQE